ncbi:MAG: arylsulfatase A-like enzyme [Akkermansiaceae bacterium]|jgi:arylsulfatase A-like enzyme
MPSRPTSTASRKVAASSPTSAPARCVLPLAHGFTHFVGHYNGAIDYFTHQREEQLDWHQNDKPLREEGYATDLLAKHAVAFINDSPKVKPYFLYLPFNAPHSPFQATKADLTLHRSLKNKKRRAYAAMVTAMDRGIGKVLAAIESRLDADNTLDILPTTLRAAGVAPPKNLDGLNVLPALQGKAQLLERPWFSYLHQGKASSSSLHLGPWKLVVKGDAFNSAHAFALELYNLDSDPGEKTTSPKNTPTESSPCFPKSKSSEPSKSPVPHPTTKAAKASSHPRTGSSSKEAQTASASSDDPLPNPKHSVSLRTAYRAESRRQVRDSIPVL